MKKLLTSLLCVVMMVTFMPSMAFAVDDLDANVQKTETGQPEDKEADNVAEIDGTKYPTIQAAINAAPTDGKQITIKLLNDAKESISVPSTANIILDLAGHQLTGKTEEDGKMANVITNAGVIMIKDSSNPSAGAVVGGADSGSGTVGRGGIAIVNEVGATTTIESGTIKRNDNGTFGNYTIYSKGGTLNITGTATVTNNSNTSSLIRSDGTMNVSGGTIQQNSMTAIKVQDEGTLNVTGGNIISENNQAIQNWANVNIAGGEIKGLVTTFTYDDEKTGEATKAVTNITGGTITGNVNAINYEGTATNAPVVKISGDAIVHGSLNAFKGTSTNSGNTATKEDANIEVSGGTFSENSNVEKYLPSGMTTAQGTDGSFTIVEKEDAAAKIGTAAYATLKEAIEAAGTTPSEITLLKEIKEDVKIDEGQNITLNLNGQKITNISGNTIYNKGTLTVKGTGVIDNVTHAKAALYNEVGATATLNGGEFTRSKETGVSPSEGGENSYYNLVNHGTMTINEGVNVNQSGHFSSLLENGWYNGNEKPSGAANSVLTINGGTFTGGINTIKNDDYGVLTIKGGTFNNTTQASVLNWNLATIEGGTFTSDQYAVLNGYLNGEMDKGELTITGGIFTSNKNTTVDTMDGSTHIGKIEINGGTFTSKEGSTLPAKDSLGEGGTVTVSKGTFSDTDALEYLATDIAKGAVTVTLPEGNNVEIPANANANVIFVAKAGTTVENNTNVTVTIKTPSGEITLEPGKEITSENPKPVDPPVIPSVQKPTIKVDEHATVTLSAYGTIATIKVAEGYEIADVTVNGVSKGKVDMVYGLKTGDVLKVTTVKKGETEAEKNARLKAGVENTTIKLKSTLGKGYIKLNWTKSEGYKVDKYQVFRSTKRYSGYGTKAYFTTKQGGLKAWYKNTKELKKGNRYYYKVRGVREIADETVYTQWSNKAWRLVK